VCVVEDCGEVSWARCSRHCRDAKPDILSQSVRYRMLALLTGFRRADCTSRYRHSNNMVRRRGSRVSSISKYNIYMVYINSSNPFMNGQLQSFKQIRKILILGNIYLNKN